MSRNQRQLSHHISVGIIFWMWILIYSGLAQTMDESQGSNLNLPQSEEDLLAGSLIAVAYSGFREGQHPDRGDGAVNPSDSEILEDLRILSKNANFNLIRLYDSQENSETVLKIIREHKLKIKVLLGMWLEAEISNHEGCFWLTEPIPDEKLAENKVKNDTEIARGIWLANEYPKIVVAVNVGNEALVEWHDHMISPDSAIVYVKRVQAAIKQAVTVSDSYGWWQKDPKAAALAEAVDFISLHSYPLWEGKGIEEGLSFTVATIEGIKNMFPDKMIVITEVGWATVASEFGERASEEQQKRYYHEMKQWAKQNNVTTFFFEAFDEDWKGDPNNPLGAEKHWGLFTVDRKAKMVMYDLYPELLPVKE
ncbi:glycosyl hydrolase [candidate division KSB1 bacterium]|nr:glycosyl hydrolase [candidate division KSB1 bacterium]